MNPSVRRAALAAALCCSAGVARAHAPLPRGLAVAPGDSAALALRMPGFGWILGTTESRKAAPKFAYACDALLGVSPYEEHVPMAYRDDGALLVGTAHGIRVLGRDGCPSSTVSLEAPIAALAVHAADPQRVYAVTTGADPPPSVYRSADAGESWLLAGALPAYAVTALVLDPADPQTLYASQTTAIQRSQIAVSSDGGASFETFEQAVDLTLLYVQSKPARLWAMTRVVGQPNGVTILRATQANGPWRELLTVNFFGGFAVDPNDADVIWVGDEARGVFRSGDGGDSFDETQPNIASACLAYGAGALWACTPGVPTKTALMRSPDAVASFESVIAFAGVDHLIDCSPAIDVEQVCAPAWVEWRRDILGLPPVVPDAGVPDPGSVAARDAATPAEAAAAGAAPHASSSCSVCVPRSARGESGWLCALVALLARRRPHGSAGSRRVFRAPCGAMANDPAKPFELEGMVTALNVLRVLSSDLAVITKALDVKIGQSPVLFKGAPVVIDVSALEDAETSAPQAPPIAQLASLLKERGLVPVGAYAQSAARVQEAAAAGLPLIDAARGKKRSGGSRVPQPWPDQEKPSSEARARTAAAGPPPPAAGRAPQGTLMLTQPLRAGQIVHAEHRDAIALAAVNSGAELLADGNIHVYAPLRGRAIAGARGDDQARIFCQKLEADLISIAGVYLSADELPPDKVGKSVQISLRDGELVLTELSSR